MADINRLKVVLVEKKRMAGFRIEKRSCNCIEMVYKYFATRFADINQDCFFVGG